MEDPKIIIRSLAESIKRWLISGKLDSAVLSDNFIFQSPFWKHASKQEFIQKFSDPKEYIETALSKITEFNPIHITISDDNNHFNIFLTYHTKNNESVNECVSGSVTSGKISQLISIYDLEETKHALEL